MCAQNVVLDKTSFPLLEKQQKPSEEVHSLWIHQETGESEQPTKPEIWIKMSISKDEVCRAERGKWKIPTGEVNYKESQMWASEGPWNPRVAAQNGADTFLWGKTSISEQGTGILWGISQGWG